ncbi:Mobile element protein [uncultured Candidatus Thioglobus sp.]|nr:Mobile element protein [uncultured Candidatus Thioglobus sp.]
MRVIALGNHNNRKTEMTSCEPTRCNAYSEDLRYRIVWQTEALGYSSRQVGNNIGVDRSTVSRIRQRWLTFGTLKKATYPQDKAYRKLTTPAQLLVLHLVMKKPELFVHEIQNELLDVLQVEVCISTISRFIHSCGFTRQKLRHVALQRDEFLRQKFILDVSLYKSDMFIFLDETGADRRNVLRKYGYSMRGKTPQEHTLLVRGEHVSGIGIISVNGLLDVYVTKGPVDGDKFYDFALKYLLPHLMPFDGINQHSVVVLDNCSIHHVDGIAAMIEEAGALVHFLPPYSHDFNPIEETFSKVKAEMKNLVDVPDIETIVLSAFATVTPEDCKGWILNNSIYTQHDD